MNSIEKEAKDFLFSLGDEAALLEDCRSVSSKKLGYMDEDKLIVRGSLVEKLPLRIRGVLAVANQISGELENKDIIKVHLTSKKVTYLGLDDFKNSPLPRITKRTIIDLRLNTVFTMSHLDKGRVKVLYLKSRLMDETDKNFRSQAIFDSKIVHETGLLFNGEGPKFEEFAKKLMELKIAPPIYE